MTESIWLRVGFNVFFLAMLALVASGLAPRCDACAKRWSKYETWS